MKIFEYIKKLDESGNYRMADKLDNEIRKIYAQVSMGASIPPNYADFVLKQMVLKQISQPKQKDTDTLSPTKNNDINIIRKQLNNALTEQIALKKQLNTLKNDFGVVGSLDSQIGALNETNESQDKNITDNTTGINEISGKVSLLEESIQTPK